MKRANCSVLFFDSRILLRLFYVNIYKLMEHTCHSYHHINDRLKITANILLCCDILLY